MGLREEIEDMKKEVKEIEEGSLAMSLLADYKSQNKRQFIIILVILGMFACLLGYTIYLLNDIGVSTETDTIDIDNVETIEEFVEEHPHGVYLCTMIGHITCIIDGCIYDTFNCSDRIMRCAWKIE